MWKERQSVSVEFSGTGGEEPASREGRKLGDEDNKDKVGIEGYSEEWIVVVYD